MGEKHKEQTSAAAFDFELFKAQFDGEGAFSDMVDLLLRELPKELEEFRAAYQIKNWNVIQNLAHRLKGGITYCGATPLKRACAQLEKAIEGQKYGLFEHLYDQLVAEILLAEKTLKENWSLEKQQISVA